jgi:hypothetical protein
MVNSSQLTADSSQLIAFIFLPYVPISAGENRLAAWFFFRFDSSSFCGTMGMEAEYCFHHRVGDFLLCAFQ